MEEVRKRERGIWRSVRTMKGMLKRVVAGGRQIKGEEMKSGL